MKLTTKSEYTLLALLFIARRGPGAYVKMDEICAEHGISKKYLEQLFSVLKHGGYIRTRRGGDGGYSLARGADEISMAEIIRLMDGALASTMAVSRYFYESSPLEKEPKIIDVFRQIRDYIAGRLEGLKLADLI